MFITFEPYERSEKEYRSDLGWFAFIMSGYSANPYGSREINQKVESLPICLDNWSYRNQVISEVKNAPIT